MVKYSMVNHSMIQDGSPNHQRQGSTEETATPRC